MAKPKAKSVAKKSVSRVKKAEKAEEVQQAQIAQAACSIAMEHGDAHYDEIQQPLPPPGKKLVALRLTDMTTGYPVEDVASKVRVTYERGAVVVHLEHGVSKDVVKLMGIEQ